MTAIDSDHARLDQRSLALHRLVAEKLLANPALLEHARSNVARWQAASDTVHPTLVEWQAILTQPVSDIAMLLVEHSERATRLRQSSPFAGVLTTDERRAIYESHAA